MTISKQDMAMLKLRYHATEPEVFGLLELAERDDPALVANAVAQIAPTSAQDQLGWDRIICSIYGYARDEWENGNELDWYSEWMDNFYPRMPYRDHISDTIFGGDGKASRFDRMSMASL